VDEGEGWIEGVFAIYSRWSAKSVKDQEVVETKPGDVGGCSTIVGSERRNGKIYPTNVTRKENQCRSTEEESRWDRVEMGNVIEARKRRK